MLNLMNSIYWRLLIAFTIIILASIVLSTTIEFMTTSSNLPHLFTEIRTKNIAQILSSAYTRDEGWGNLEQEITRLELNGVDQDYNFSESLRVVVRDSEGKTIYNSFSGLTELGHIPLIEGDSMNIIDLNNSIKAGTVTLYINRNYLDHETAGYILTLLKSRLMQGLFSLIILVFVAALLSHRITAPLAALTLAAQSIAQSGKASLLPVKSSDEIGQLSESFNKMIVSLETQKNLRKRLIGDVSHEINTPLSVIKLEALGMNKNMISTKAATGQIIDEVDTLINLVHDLDWLAETDSGEFKLNMEPYPIEKLIKNEVERWQLKAEIAEISLVLSPLPQLPELNIDVVRMSQVLGNLIENGLKYAFTGGSLIVKCELDRNQLIISVRDNGPGISAEDIPYIFERFFRADESRTSNKGGSGLGLSIVRQIVEMHQGQVWVESEANRGSTFYVSLPS